MKRINETEFLRQQLQLLAEESKDTCPASNELSQNSLAMAKISNELFKRKWFAAMFLVAFNYLLIRFAVQRK